MKQVIDLELKFRSFDILLAELIFELDQLILKLDSQFPFIIEVVFKLFLGLLELLSLVFEHELEFSSIIILMEIGV